MAFKLDKKQIQRRGDLAGQLQVFAESVRDAVNKYNEVVRDAEEFVTEVHESWRSEFDEKSEKWQESDRGQEISGLIDEWEGVSVEEIDVPDMDHSNILEGLQESV